MRANTLILTGIILMVSVVSEAQEALILRIHGSVKIRRGVSEEWLPARPNMFLRRIDTIMSEGNSWAELRIDEKETYRLPQKAMLDICDLKRISEDELFLMLMDQKLFGTGKAERKLNVSS